jgi:hypothetical protein
MTPYSIYYLHYKDSRHLVNNWNSCKDYVCCVMAENVDHAIEITTDIALNQQSAACIKIMGIGFCKQEWTAFDQPMKTNENDYKLKIYK